MFEITLSLKEKQLSGIFKYQSFGLNIQSTFAIPELNESDFTDADVKISFGKNPIDLVNIKGCGVLYQAKKNDFLFRLETVGSYRVQHGNSITVERLNNSTDDEIRLFLLGSAFGAMIHQRGLLPFHGSTIVRAGKAIVIGGASGAGKSSLAAALVKRGYKLLADDITVIDIINNETIVYPGIPHMKLWQDVMEKLGENVSIYPKVRPQLLKYRKPAVEYFENVPVVLDHLIILSPKNTKGFEISEVKGSEKFSLLRNNTFRYQFLHGLGKTESHFNLVSKLAGQIRISTLQRPSSPLMLDELAEFIEKHV